MRVDVDVSGPLFDGRAPGIVAGFLREAQRDVGAQARSDVQEVLDRRIRRPTPYYETQILSERVGSVQVVHDRRIVYGPWLEGVSGRNRSTGFGGYHAFRVAHERLSGRIPSLVRGALERAVARL